MNEKIETPKGTELSLGSDGMLTRLFSGFDYVTGIGWSFYGGIKRLEETVGTREFGEAEKEMHKTTTDKHYKSWSSKCCNASQSVPTCRD